MYAHAEPADTAEGEALDQVSTFKKLWEQRVIANDNTGPDVFITFQPGLSKAGFVLLRSTRLQSRY